MILSDKTLRKEITNNRLVKNVNLHNIQPSSVDITLSNSFATTVKTDKTYELKDELPYNTFEDTDYIIIHPHEFVLATTQEHFVCPDNVCGFVEGRSSIGRLGLFIQNAGWIDAGFEGEITLELYNASENSYILRAGQRVGQIVFATMDEKAEHPYRGKYQGQTGATTSRISQDED